MSLAEQIDPPQRFDSAAAFLAWVERQPERYELFEGQARMMTGGTKNHARISGAAYAALRAALLGGPCEPFGSDFAVILGPGHVVYPDASVSCAPEGEDGLRHPVVIVEVLSPSTAAYDRGEKATAYRRAPSLRHLVLIRQDRVAVEHFHRAAAGEDFTLTEIDRLADAVRLSAIDVDIPLLELYAQVEFGRD